MLGLYATKNEKNFTNYGMSNNTAGHFCRTGSLELADCCYLISGLIEPAYWLNYTKEHQHGEYRACNFNQWLSEKSP